MPPGLPPPDYHGRIEDFLVREIRALEVLFDDPGMRRLQKRFPKHPAVLRHEVMRRFLANELPLTYPNETTIVLSIGSIMLDILSGDHAPEVLTSQLGAEVLLQLRQRVADPNQFDDQMSALGCWSMLRSKGIEAHVVEADGLPDIRIALAESATHWIEAKRLRLGKQAKQVRSVLKSANKQIKRAGGGVGSVYLHVERPQQRVVFDDAVPAAVQQYIDEANRELYSGFARSVSEVIVAWDDYMLLGSPPARTMYFFRRRSKVLTHRAPRGRSLLPADALVVGRTVVVPIDWGAPDAPSAVVTPSIRVGATTVTELFRQECELPGYVRSVHAVEALSTAEASERYIVGDRTILLATRRIKQGHEPYTLLIIAAEREDATEIYLAFRLYYASDYLQDDLVPGKAFEVLLRRYGVAMTLADSSGLFIPAVRVQGRADVILRAASPQGGEVLVHAMIRQDPAGFSDIAWAFALAKARYAADIRSRRL